MTERTNTSGKGSAPSADAGNPAKTNAPATSDWTPEAALARHVEWLEFALAAARSEESWRVARLEKATKKSRDKRHSRLAEVREEIGELTALVEAIHGLQARKVSRSTAAAKPRSANPRKRSTAAAKTRAASAAAGSAVAGTVAPSAAATAKKPTTTRRRSTKTTKPGGSTPTLRRRRASGPATDRPA